MTAVDDRDPVRAQIERIHALSPQLRAAASPRRRLAIEIRSAVAIGLTSVIVVACVGGVATAVVMGIIGWDMPVERRIIIFAAIAIAVVRGSTRWRKRPRSRTSDGPAKTSLRRADFRLPYAITGALTEAMGAAPITVIETVFSCSPPHVEPRHDGVCLRIGYGLMDSLTLDDFLAATAAELAAHTIRARHPLTRRADRWREKARWWTEPGRLANGTRRHGLKRRALDLVIGLTSSVVYLVTLPLALSVPASRRLELDARRAARRAQRAVAGPEARQHLTRALAPAAAVLRSLTNALAFSTTTPPANLIELIAAFRRSMTNRPRPPVGDGAADGDAPAGNLPPVPDFRATAALWIDPAGAAAEQLTRRIFPTEGREEHVPLSTADAFRALGFTAERPPMESRLFGTTLDVARPIAASDLPAQLQIQPEEAETGVTDLPEPDEHRAHENAVVRYARALGETRQAVVAGTAAATDSPPDAQARNGSPKDRLGRARLRFDHSCDQLGASDRDRLMRLRRILSLRVLGDVEPNAAAELQQVWNVVRLLGAIRGWREELAFELAVVSATCLSTPTSFTGPARRRVAAAVFSIESRLVELQSRLTGADGKPQDPDAATLLVTVFKGFDAYPRSAFGIVAGATDAAQRIQILERRCLNRLLSAVVPDDDEDGLGEAIAGHNVELCLGGEWGTTPVVTHFTSQLTTGEYPPTLLVTILNVLRSELHLVTAIAVPMAVGAVLLIADAVRSGRSLDQWSPSELAMVPLVPWIVVTAARRRAAPVMAAVGLIVAALVGSAWVGVPPDAPRVVLEIALVLVIVRMLMLVGHGLRSRVLRRLHADLWKEPTLSGA